jgi:hypothetical protein
LWSRYWVLTLLIKFVIGIQFSGSGKKEPTKMQISPQGIKSNFNFFLIFQK